MLRNISFCKAVKLLKRGKIARPRLQGWAPIRINNSEFEYYAATSKVWATLGGLGARCFSVRWDEVDKSAGSYYETETKVQKG